MLGKLISELWYLILIVILMGVFSLFKAKIKGFVGEKTIAAFLTRLDKNKYKILNDVLMDVNGKSSQTLHRLTASWPFPSVPKSVRVREGRNVS